MKHLITKNTILVLLLILFFPGFSQDKTPYFFSLNYRTGENKPHREVIKNLTYPYRGIEAKLGWQSVGKQNWQQAYRYPSYGIGVNWSTFKTDILGAPTSVYAFTNFPQLTTKWARLDLEVDLGISHGINPYDEITNPENFSTGSTINAFFGFYLEQSFHVSKNMDLFVSEGLTHYSNGALGFPNLGLNIPSLKFGFRYTPNPIERAPKRTLPGVENPWQLNTFIAFGTKTFREPTPYYKELVIAPTLYYRTSYKRRIGFGFEGAYNDVFQAHYITRDYTGKQLLTAAVFGAHEFIIERFSILTQFGIYLHNKPLETFYYERVGMGFYLTPSMRVSLSLKAHYVKAEYVEFGIIYDLNFR